MKCPFCSHTNHTESYLPKTRFNNKVFSYISCVNCNLIYIYPVPSNDDFEKMYPPSYQNGADNKILDDPYKKLIGLRFSYGYQFDLIEKFGRGGVLLDYGCGTANFIANATHYGFSCVGAEYNPEHVKRLEALLSNKFYLIKSVLSGSAGKFDVIRMSNVLEHLPDPVIIVSQLLDQLNPGGLLLIEGPIETNTNLALFTRKIYFGLRRMMNKNWKASHVPTHMFFSNRKNQRNFFNQFELKELCFQLAEAEWPYPASIAGSIGVGGKIKATIAKISILISSFNKNWGNTFIYVGRKK